MKIFKKILKKKSIDNEKRKNCEIINRWFEKNEKNYKFNLSTIWINWFASVSKLWSGFPRISNTIAGTPPSSIGMVEYCGDE